MNKPEYTLHKDHKTRINSAHTAVKALLPLELYLTHKRELLSICIWKITQADGKFKTRYWSEGALSASVKGYRHDHVFTRKELIDRLLSGEDVDSVLKNAIACIVTIQEHKSLTQSTKSGWKRYKECGIQVYDSAMDEWMLE